MWPRLRDGFVAVVIGLIAELLIAVIQHLLSSSGVDFPPSILAMAGVFLFLLLCGCVVPGMDGFYKKHLQGPANLLNRHMSIGFTIPFVQICDGNLASPRTIGVITACFLLTGIFNTVLSYVFALPLQCLMSRWTRRQGAEVEDDASQGVEYEPEHKASMVTMTSEDAKTMASRASTPTERMLEAQELAGAAVRATGWAAIGHWLLQNPMFVLSWILAIAVGLPLRYALQHDTFFATCLLSAVWFSMLVIQSSLKTSKRLPSWLSIVLSGLSNPVLWTSLTMIAYLFIDGAISGRSLHEMLNTLQTRKTLADLVLRKATTTAQVGEAVSGKDGMAAGDIAISILNAGLVSWGLKLYEYRRQLLSRAGLTVFSVSSLLALGNVALGPVFAYSLTLTPAKRDLAFAARSVTLALGKPALTQLGGDEGLNATMVVVSGILFQMGLGFGAGAWLEKEVTLLISRLRCIVPSSGTKTEDPETAQRSAAGLAVCIDDDPQTVAAGVTVGINAAAMGTAYLYEVKSDAAPYSALSMMALGIMTVVFASIPPLQAWILTSVAGST